jgi:hypothetical protein
VAAIIFCVLMAALALFQSALALGAPMGQFAWGGQNRVLPPGLRMGSGIAIGLYALFSCIVLMRAGLLAPWPDSNWIDPAIWAVAAYMGLGVVVNAISRSRPERLTMTPLVIVLLILTLVVALA